MTMTSTLYYPTILATVYISCALLCLVHFRAKHGRWPDTISESVTRETELGEVDPEGTKRFWFFCAGNAVVAALLFLSEVNLIQMSKVVPAATDSISAVWRDHGVTLLPFAGLIIFTAIGTLLCGQDFHGQSKRFFPDQDPKKTDDVPDDWTLVKHPRIANYLAIACNLCVALLGILTLARAIQRSRIVPVPFDHAPFVRPSLLYFTYGAWLVSVTLFMLVNVPRTYGLHISFTVIGAVSALVYLDVRSIHSLRSVFALLGVFVCFPLHSVLRAPWGAIAETGAFTCFFACYAFHIEDVRALAKM